MINDRFYKGIRLSGVPKRSDFQNTSGFIRGITGFIGFHDPQNMTGFIREFDVPTGVLELSINNSFYKVFERNPGNQEYVNYDRFYKGNWTF